jgi:DNA-binding MarR family transcriptional regulator
MLALKPTKTDIIKLATTVDNLVDALYDPSVSLRRAMILLDIDEHPKTTQNAICARLKLEKSVVSRNIDWLCERGCVLRQTAITDARESELQTSLYTHKHLQLALKSFGNNHFALKKTLDVFINAFSDHMPSLRDLKALLTVGAKGEATRADIVNNLYDGPQTTDQRAIRTLIDEGLVKDDGQ